MKFDSLSSVEAEMRLLSPNVGLEELVQSRLTPSFVGGEQNDFQESQAVEKQS